MMSDNPHDLAPRDQPVILDPESRPRASTPRGVDARATDGGRLSAVRDWLSKRADTRLARLSLLWFRRYLEASHNSGAAAAAYVTLSVFPTALVIIAIFNRARGAEHTFSERLITHMNLDGATASLVHDMFGTTANNLLAASVTTVISFLIWGLSIGLLYQDVYARAWRIRVGSAADQALFTIWFFVFSGLVALMTVSAAELRALGWLVVLPAWITGSMIFWLWTPRFLLHRKISLRSLLPGALLATFVVGGTVGTSPLWIGPTLNQNAKAFGAFGVVLGLFAYILIVVTISMVCAVFAPVWAEWRQGEKNQEWEEAHVGSEQPVLSGTAGSDERQRQGG
jgi:membrane protein